MGDICTTPLIVLLAAFRTTQLVQGQGVIMEALILGNSSNDTRREECIWRRSNDRDPCPDPLIHFTLHTNSDSGVRVENVSVGAGSWLRESGYNPDNPMVVLVHGYAGVEDWLPIGVLRDAYLNRTGYNVVVEDWGGLARIPCYAAAVHNVRTAARCLAQLLAFLRRSGVPVQDTTCVGHSLGAHVCGVAANYLQHRIHRIIGVDPARPLIRNQNKARLDAGDARVVQVLHTSATYGDPRRAGHIDFCINGGRIQPFCTNTTNEPLCSHLRSVCYLAESLYEGLGRLGVPCSRRCPSTSVTERHPLDRTASPVPLGQHTPDNAEGMYCVSNEDAPFCPSNNKAGVGSKHCCVLASEG